VKTFQATKGVWTHWHNVHSNNYFTSLEIHSMRWNHQKRRKIRGWNFSSSHQQTWRHTLWWRHLATRDARKFIYKIFWTLFIHKTLLKWEHCGDPFAGFSAA